MLRQRVLKGFALLTSGQMLSQALNLTRNVLIARMIGPEEFGTGLTFALIATFFEMMSDLSLDKFIVQNGRGHSPDAQATIQAIAAVRGVLLAAAIYLTSPYIAVFFNVPDIAWAYQCLAVMPLCAGLTHFDFRRYQRELHYLPEMKVDLAGNGVAFIVGIACAWILGDFRAMLFAAIVRYVVFALVSHVVSERPYRLYLVSDIAKQVWHFGWPLTINGLVLFLSAQGDRTLVAKLFGIQALGVYGAVALITQVTLTLITRALNAISLPLLARNNNEDDISQLYQRTVVIYCSVATAIAFPLFVFLSPFLPLVFGASFTAPNILVNLLVCLLALRVMQGCPTVVVIALGMTRTLMFGTFLKGSGFAIAFAVSIFFKNIAFIPAGFIFSDILASLFLVYRIRSVGVKSSPDTLLAVVVACTALAAATVGSSVLGSGALLDNAVYNLVIFGLSFFVLYAATPFGTLCKELFRS